MSPFGKKEEISRYLLRADPELNYYDKELFEINDREGLYYEKPNWIEKYLRRDKSDWSELCLPQYVKMYDPTNREEKEIEEDNDKDDDFIEDVTEAKPRDSKVVKSKSKPKAGNRKTKFPL